MIEPPPSVLPAAGPPPACASASALFATLGLAGVVALVALDQLAFGLAPLREGRPDLSAGALWRIAAWIGIAALLVAALCKAANPGAAPVCLDRVDLLPRTPVARAGWLLVLLVACALPFVLRTWPKGFHAWSLEDRVVEWASVALLLLACACCAGAVRRRRAACGGFDLVGTAVALIGLVVFVIAGEEVSWFQRVIGIETPQAFSGNDQQEMNLHNFITDPTENAFYFGAGFVLPVLLPLWLGLGLPLGPLGRLAPVAPQPYLLGLGAVIAAFNYDMWNGAPTQLAFWGSVVVLGAIAWRSRPGPNRWAALLLLLMMLGMQAMFLCYGYRSWRPWDVTEYKELLIAAVLFLYAFDLRSSAAGRR